MRKISYDHRAITIDGARTLILSGTIHYPRSTPAMWPAMMERCQQAGLNTIETYVFWNLHERQRNVFDFSGRLDILRFCELAQQYGLNVILRIGPYICAEINYGGFPAWLRDVPGMQMRTYNEPFMREMERWVRYVTDYLRPMFASNGGPIILAQMENEYGNIAKNYGEAGQKYLQWAGDLGQSLNLNIPWIMCVGGTNGVIETINTFYGHQEIARHFEAHPNQPALWTEAWVSWYNTWGGPVHQRSPEDMAYAILRFVAAGGTGVDYYMWHGGTNFGREAMYLQTTGYEFDAPLDEFGLPTTKYNHVTRLHNVLQEYAPILLQHEPAAAQKLGPQQWIYSYGQGDKQLAFLCNDMEEGTAQIKWENQTYNLAGRSVVLLAGGHEVFNTNQVAPDALIKRSHQPVVGLLSSFEWWPEPLPQNWPTGMQSSTKVAQPVEQLQFTHDESDYCWYSTQFTTGQAVRKARLVLDGVADIAHILVDGKLIATTPTVPLEERGLFDGGNFSQSFELELEPGAHQLSILCAALGLIKGDWMLGQQNQVAERKGLWGRVTWAGQPLENSWTIQPGLVGEQAAIYQRAGSLAQWHGDTTTATNQPLCWWRTTFDRPTAAQDEPLIVDLQGMNKGLAWLNGQCIGRYWLTPALDIVVHKQPVAIRRGGIGEATQRFYHLPAEWLQAKNVVVLFEELGGDPSNIQICRWLQS